jgi:2-aminoadipate transaminase
VNQLFSRDADRFRPSAIRAFARLINDPAIISFAGGVPSPETFPMEALSEIAAQMIRERGAVALQYGPTRGLMGLREEIVRICSGRGFDTSPDDVIVTTGSQQALDLVAHTFLDPGDVVLVELPTYIGATSSFLARSADLAGVVQDGDGINPQSLREVATRVAAEGRRAKLLYTIPNFQNPSGRLLSQARRPEIVALARELGFLIIEDDPYGELVYDEGADTTPLRSHDQEHVVYLGSFSKILAPGLRCGFIVAGATIGRKLEIAKEAADLCSGMLDQSIVEEFLRRGALPAQIERVRAFYRGKRNVTIEALERHFGDLATWTAAIGGLFTMVSLSRPIDTAAHVQAAIDAGVAYIPGGPFFVDGSGANTMRLTFAKETDDRLRDGIARLAALFRDDACLTTPHRD